MFPTDQVAKTNELNEKYAELASDVTFNKEKYEELATDLTLSKESMIFKYYVKLLKPISTL